MSQMVDSGCTSLKKEDRRNLLLVVNCTKVKTGLQYSSSTGRRKLFGHLEYRCRYKMLDF